MADETVVKEEGKSILKGALGLAEQAVSAKLGVDRLKVKAENMIEDAVIDARRMAKKGRYAAEDMIDETAHMIKRDPFRSVGVTFAAGFGIGIIAGWLMTRRSGNNIH